MQGIRSYLFHTFADKYAGNSDYFIWKKNLIHDTAADHNDVVIT